MSKKDISPWIWVIFVMGLVLILTGKGFMGALVPGDLVSEDITNTTSKPPIDKPCYVSFRTNTTEGKYGLADIWIALDVDEDTRLEGYKGEQITGTHSCEYASCNLYKSLTPEGYRLWVGKEAVFVSSDPSCDPNERPCGFIGKFVVRTPEAMIDTIPYNPYHNASQESYFPKGCIIEEPIKEYIIKKSEPKKKIIPQTLKEAHLMALINGNISGEDQCQFGFVFDSRSNQCVEIDENQIPVTKIGLMFVAFFGVIYIVMRWKR